MTQEHAKYEQEVIYGTTYDIYIYIYIEIYIEIKKIRSKLVYEGLAHARPNKLGECRTLWGERERVHAGAEFAWNSCMTLC